MTDKVETPEALAERICCDALSVEKATALIRADREAVLQPFERLAFCFERDSAASREAQLRARAAANDTLDEIYGATCEHMEHFAERIRQTIAALLPPHQPPKSEGDGEANGGQP